MFYAWRTPDYVSRFDFHYRASPLLCPANAGGNDQVLPCRVNVPCGSSPWLEGDVRTGKMAPNHLQKTKGRYEHCR